MEPLRGERTSEAESSIYELKAISSTRPSRASRPYDLRKRDVRQRWLWKTRNLSSKWWLWELSACALSLLLVALIIYQLQQINNKETWEWTWPWEPTAVLAFSVTIMKATIMAPVASSISQLKWHWFQNFRKLDGMEHFDEASRGVLGSIRLLMTLKFWRLASVGAIITISSLAVDTLAQNAVKFRHVPNVWNNSFSKVMATDVFNIYSPRRAGPFPTRDFRANVNFALTSMANLTMFDYYLWECDELADYCDFPRYQSLAVGTQCVKQEVKRDGSVVRHPSSNDTDFQLGLTDGLINSTTAVDYPTGPGFVDLGPLIFRWLILANPDTLKPLPTAMECAFYWTVNSYEGRAFNGTLSENITLTWTNITDRETIPHNITLTPPECLRDNSTIREDVYEDESGKEVAFTPDPCSNYVSAQGQRSLQSYFTDNEGGLIGSVSNDTRSDDTETYYNSSSLAMTSLLHYIWLANSTADIAGNVTEYADRLAWALTFSVRISLRGYRDDTYPFYFYGYTWGNDVYRPDTYYRISWGYLVLPIAFVISGSLFFAATVVLTWRDTKWKSSILAVVLHGLSPADLNTVGNVDGYADMREVGRSMQARLVSTELGKKLMSRDAIMDED